MTRYATRHPWLITLAMLLSRELLAGLALMPTLWPERFSALQRLKVDTAPENMLPEEEPVRVFPDQMKRKMNLHDMVGGLSMIQFLTKNLSHKICRKHLRSLANPIMF